MTKENSKGKNATRLEIQMIGSYMICKAKEFQDQAAKDCLTQAKFGRCNQEVQHGFGMVSITSKEQLQSKAFCSDTLSQASWLNKDICKQVQDNHGIYKYLRVWTLVYYQAQAWML